MTASIQEKPQADLGLPTAGRQPKVAQTRLLVGITSPQTCLVLSGRLSALRRAGFDVLLVSSPGELLESTAQSEGVTAFPVAMQRGIAPLADLRSFWALLRLLYRYRPAITDFSTPKAGLLGNLAAWVARVPHRVYTLRGLKLEASHGFKRTLLLWSERQAARCAHIVLCNSNSLRQAALTMRIAPAGKLRLLGEGSSNGVDTGRFSPREAAQPDLLRTQLGIQPEEIVLGFVGRLTADKGVPELLLAFDPILHAAPHSWLLLVGWFDQAEDALEERWRSWIARHPRIRYTGFVPDTSHYYRAMDILILPTHREGFPNAVLEASASGIPVITTETTGARDAVLAEVTGLLIPPGHPDAIADAALSLIQDKSKRARLGKAGRSLAIQHYSQERVLGLAVEFYKGLMRPAQRDDGALPPASERFI